MYIISRAFVRGRYFYSEVPSLVVFNVFDTMEPPVCLVVRQSVILAAEVALQAASSVYSSRNGNWLPKRLGPLRHFNTMGSDLYFG
jgi:hypothetical protein